MAEQTDDSTKFTKKVELENPTAEKESKTVSSNLTPKSVLSGSFSNFDNCHVSCIFRVRISGIQCRNLAPRKMSGTSDPFVEFQWVDPSTTFTTTVIKGNLNPTWKGATWSIEYSCTLSELQHNFLSISVYSERTFSNKKLIGSTRIDLLTIATGPVHHDHQLSGCLNGRVVFNCYMDQYSDWEVTISNIGILKPALRDDYDRPEGHDFQEDASLPLRRYGVSYRCTVGMTETFYLGDSLKVAEPAVDIQDKISFQALAKLKILVSRKNTISRLHGHSSFEGEERDNAPSHQEPVEVEEPVLIEWSALSDYLPSITKYSTFDDLMSATLKIEVRYLTEGHGQSLNEPEIGFLQMLEQFQQDLKQQGSDVVIDKDMNQTTLYGQCWLSLEKLFEDAMQEKIRENGEEPSPWLLANDSEKWVTNKFEQNLMLKGHQVGYVYGTIIFKKVPDVRQLRSGVISEHGITSSSSVIVGPSNGKSRKSTIPDEALRVQEKMEGLFYLMANRNKDEKEGKIRKATKILRVLQVSHKASMFSWVYRDSNALYETKAILMRLWSFLLENIRVRDYTLRNVFYELLFYLLKRAELGDLGLLGFGHISHGNPTKKELEFGIKYRAMLYETKSCVVQAVSVRGVLNNNFMFFVARILSVLCFRLPSFGSTIYEVWSQTYVEPIDELVADFRETCERKVNRERTEPLLDWVRFHQLLKDRYGHSMLKSQEDDADEKYEVIDESWKNRLSHRSIKNESNTLNILLVDQWMWYVLDTIAVLNQKISWSNIPGYPQLLKVFFCELYSQRSGPLSPGLYKLSCTMLASSFLINPMAKILLSTTCVHDVSRVIAAVELLGVWMYMIRSWRVRLGSYRLSHLENNDRWNFHRDDQYSIPTGDEVALLPPSFDYRFICSALRVLLASEQTQVLLTTLEFLYNCWDCFPERQADKLRYELLQVFMKLFLHWHPNVRYFYQTLLAFRAMKPHGWTQQGSSFVSTPPHSRRHIDAAAADFTSALGAELNWFKKRSRSYSASNIMESVRKIGETLSSPRGSSSASSSPRNRVGSPSSATSSPSSNRGYGQEKLRSVSDDYTNASRNNGSPSTPSHSMDPTLQLEFNKNLESIYSAAQGYIHQVKPNQHHIKNAAAVKATWKKKGALLKQGFLYKNTWKKKYFSLSDNKLCYSETENGSVKKEMNIIGCRVLELPSHVDHTGGSRTVLYHCFSVDNSYQKFVLSASSLDDMLDWMDVLTQNAAASETEDEYRPSSYFDVSGVAGAIKEVAGKHSEADIRVPSALRPYTAVAVKEWLNFRIEKMDIEARIASGQPFTLPVLQSKSPSYDQDS